MINETNKHEEYTDNIVLTDKRPTYQRIKNFKAKTTSHSLVASPKELLYKEKEKFERLKRVARNRETKLQDALEEYRSKLQKEQERVAAKARAQSVLEERKFQEINQRNRKREEILRRLAAFRAQDLEQRYKKSEEYAQLSYSKLLSSNSLTPAKNQSVILHSSDIE